ncbi:efflux RND transporter permease subunit [Rhodopirellula sp. MGV]|uniref:efflux RND transporter permease subunit n=1 Tax=Rhodopirellula sp. MGV TaxID=2023130 RepID=UPI000B967C2A|nr:efflux RND transporter permease subunit [Rhodopirellula sp. MGV]OYP31082.1 cation transporter [Rhodopirellula sp. MGV]PNY34737.1 AcrB/AcrD/AcrF family protein [Rhodopirellula baltica]
MLDSIIRFSLKNRLVVLAVAVILMIGGAWRAFSLPIDVFPNLNRPRVVVMTEAPGMAPEEVEALITFPLETAFNGASGVEAVRSSSGIGLSVIYVEFGWGTDIYNDRQIVNERLQLAQETLPSGIKPTLAPISSIMGQILMYAMWSEGEETQPMEVRTLADWVVRQRLLTIPGVSQVFTMGGGRMQYQVLLDPDKLREFDLTIADVHTAVDESNLNATGGYLDERGSNELLVRGLGRITGLDDLRQIVVVMRGNRPISLADVARVVEGPQVKRGDSSALIRQPDDSIEGGPSVVLTINKQPGADTRAVDDAIRSALDELKLTMPGDIRIEKVYSQRAFIDRAIDNVIEALADGGVLVLVILFLFLLNFRTTFVTLTAIPLSIVTTAIVFAAMGLSINTMTLGGIAVAIGELVDDAIVDVENIFRRLKEWRSQKRAEKQSAILHATEAIGVVYRASVEVRSSVVYGTAIVVLVFLPLFALEGMEGKLFVPMAMGYVVSLLASLVVSLTVTPALSSLLLVGNRTWRWVTPLFSFGIAVLSVGWVIPRILHMVGLGDQWGNHLWIYSLLLTPLVWGGVVLTERLLGGEEAEEGRLLVGLHGMVNSAIGFSTRNAAPVLVVTALMVLFAATTLFRLENDFLPPFNEGCVQVNALLPPGSSLATSNKIGMAAQEALIKIPAVRSVARKTGRAELDEHAEGVNVTEMFLEIEEDADRELTIQQIRQTMDEIPGVVSSTEQPLAHLISHMISGVKAQIGIKLYGDDLDLLRKKAEEMKSVISDIPGLADVMIEQQTNIPQLRIELDRPALTQAGLRPAQVMEMVETAMNGTVVSQVLLGQRSFNLLVRMDEPYREDLSKLRRLVVPLPNGGRLPLETVAKIYESGGPNTIKREQVRRRIVLQANVADRGVVDVVSDIKDRLSSVELPPGYFIEYGGQFESQRSASRRLALLSAAAFLGMFLVLFTLFGNVNFAMQVLVALPTAFVGAVAALAITEQNLTVAAMVGFISLCGIASRNGILLLNHYIHLVKEEGESWTQSMVRRAGQERMAPVLMTALTSGIGLLPLALAAGEPGKEILYPIATVIVGGLITSTIAEFFVRPALFWAVGVGAGKKIVAKDDELAFGEISTVPE